MMDIRYCPNCVTEMKKDTRKLGKESKFYVCPECGVRERQSEEQNNSIIKENKNDKDKLGYYDCSEDNAIFELMQQKELS